MDISNLQTQYKLFHKYWYHGSDTESLKDLKTADQLRIKIIPQLEDLLNDEIRGDMAKLFGEFAEFLFDYFMLSMKLDNNNTAVYALHQMKEMAQRAVTLDQHCWIGHYFLVAHHSWNLKKTHTGDIPALYRGEDAATTIVGTAFNLLFKGVTLGATATMSGISKSNFSNSVRNLLSAYQWHVQQSSLDAIQYLKMTTRLFDIADYCEDIRNRLWQDIYRTVRDVDLSNIDYSELNPEEVPDAKEAVMEFYILADSKV